MAGETINILQNLAAGSEAQLYADSMAVQIAKVSLTGAALMSFLVAVYLFFKQIGNLTKGKKSIGLLICMILAGGGAYLLYDKAQGYEVLDDKNPVIEISPSALQYDVRKSGWSVAWSDIEQVELAKETTRKSKSMPETSTEIRVHIKDGHPVQWKYPPADDNDMAGVKSTFEKTRFLVVRPEPLGVDAEILQKALEKYRTGT